MAWSALDDEFELRFGLESGLVLSVMQAYRGVRFPRFIQFNCDNYMTIVISKNVILNKE